MLQDAFVNKPFEPTLPWSARIANVGYQAQNLNMKIPTHYTKPWNPRPSIHWSNAKALNPRTQTCSGPNLKIPTQKTTSQGIHTWKPNPRDPRLAVQVLAAQSRNQDPGRKSYKAQTKSTGIYTYIYIYKFIFTSTIHYILGSYRSKREQYLGRVTLERLLHEHSVQSHTTRNCRVIEMILWNLYVALQWSNVPIWKQLLLIDSG